MTSKSSPVSALFVRGDSVYKALGVECWDEARDARTYSGPGPVVAHPPCRGWGRLRQFAKVRPDERSLAVLAVRFVREFGGVLEHPHGSSLWGACGLPRPSEARDAWGGFTLLLDQGWWGHPAPKPTWVYVCGVRPVAVPSMPVQARRAVGRTTHLDVADRERTPEPFARWLVSLARLAVTPTWCAASYTDLVPCGSGGERLAAVKRAAFQQWAAGNW
jgi:hypothetical protein